MINLYNLFYMIIIPLHSIIFTNQWNNIIYDFQKSGALSRFMDADLIAKYMLSEEQRLLCVKKIIEDAVRTILYCVICTVSHLLFCIILYYTVLYYTVLYCAVLCYIYRTVLYCTVLCHIYCTVLCHTYIIISYPSSFVHTFVHTNIHTYVLFFHVIFILFYIILFYIMEFHVVLCFLNCFYVRDVL